MAITVKHTKVSTIPDGDDSSLIRPSDWNAEHQLTGTVPVANGGTGAATLTGYVKGNGTSAMTAASTIPNTDVTGLGTISTQNANNVSITGGSISGTTVSGYIPTTEKGVANGVATLDSGGKVPVSQIPALGDLNYQGTWNASTNTPTLTSSVGTKGYYYVVSVAGSTNLNGITDWQIGDWAVYNGSAWQKIDNTDAVTSVNGYTGTVVLNYSDVGAFPATSTTGSGNVVLATGATLNNPTISNYEAWTSASAPSYTEGLQWYDSTAHALAYYNDSANSIVHIGQDIQVKVINNTGSTIANGSPVYITSTSSGQTYPNIALAKADVAATSAVIGLTNGAIANGAIGYVTSQGGIDNVNTGSFTVGQVLYLSPYSAGQLMNTIPPTGITVQVGVVSYVNSSTGKIYVKQTTPLAVPASIITGTLGVANGGTGVQTITGYIKGSGTSAFTGSSTIPTTDLSGTVTNAQLANSAITINGTSTSLGGSISVGTVTSVTGTAPVVSSGGTTPAISMAKATSSVDGYLSSTDWTTFNNKQPAGSYLTAVTADAPLSGSGTSASHLVIAQANTSTSGYLSSTDWNTFNNKQPAGTYVTSVSATAPITSSGGTTPTLAMPAATSSVNGYLTSTDWTTFNNKGSGSVTSVSALTLGTTGTDLSSSVANSTTTPVITLNVPTASASNRGALSAADWTTFNSKAPATTYTTNYIPYGQGTTTPNQSANLQWDGSTMRVGSTALLGGTTNPIVGITGGSTNYIQGYIYNSTNGTSSSADIVAYPNNGTDAHGWVDMGITSQTYADTTYTVTGPNEAYLFGSAPSGAGKTGNLVYATDSTGSANAHQFYVGGFTQAKSAWKAQIDTTGVKATQLNATNGIICNSKSISASFTIASGDNAMSTGPVTVASGQSVTVSSGSRWVVL